MVDLKQDLLFKRISSFKMNRLIKKSKKCLGCGSKKIGEGKGSFEITEYHIKRVCKCGFELVTSNVFDEDGKRTRIIRQVQVNR